MKAQNSVFISKNDRWEPPLNVPFVFICIYRGDFLVLYMMLSKQQTGRSNKNRVLLYTGVHWNTNRPAALTCVHTVREQFTDTTVTV